MPLGFLVTVLLGPATGADLSFAVDLPGDCRALLAAAPEFYLIARLKPSSPRTPNPVPDFAPRVRAYREDNAEAALRHLKAKPSGSAAALPEPYRGQFGGQPLRAAAAGAPARVSRIYTFCTLLL